jgi:hypothetical protein
VDPDPRQRSAQAAEDGEVDQRAAHDRVRPVGAVDDAAVEADRVPDAQRDEREDKRDGDGRRGQRRDPDDEAGDRQAPQPDRLAGVEPDPPDVGAHERRLGC